jgi:anti-anti-sigma factor
MNITKKGNSEALTLVAEGIIDSSSASEFEAAVKDACENATNITIDFFGVEFISSAGLRVLLLAQKGLNATGGSLTLINVNESVREVFELTGIMNYLNVV